MKSARVWGFLRLGAFRLGTRALAVVLWACTASCMIGCGNDEAASPGETVDPNNSNNPSDASATGNGAGDASADSSNGPSTSNDAGQRNDARANSDANSADAAARVCVSPCASDNDCYNSCPSFGANTVACCDLATGVCFGSSSIVCPSATPDGGTTGPY